ncbi:adenylate/guanylate cyclase domain-containing protein [Salinimonas iocasae]|uniref:Adenylate/guanylate cyclase domain-containing protein n=2 Tax=Salinimonas iocasae TaxID=2572577 RepID=A0A5B7YDH7_9ALTE|nr:adenylate/guanylate cyclase domain-containing protein [Salinimonas iocasae]
MDTESYFSGFTRRFKTKLHKFQRYLFPDSPSRLITAAFLCPLFIVIAPWLILVLISYSVLRFVHAVCFKCNFSDKCMLPGLQTMPTTVFTHRYTVAPGSLSQRRFLENVTVIFADLAGFTQLCRQYGDMFTVNLLDDLFWQLDTQCQHYNIHKIKTTGDGLLAISGAVVADGCTLYCPDPAQHRVRNSISFAHSILTVTQLLSARYGVMLQMRIGIATGPVIIDCLGRFKQQPDIWGNTVNCAASLEQSTLPGTIRICPVTRRLLTEVS